MDSVNLRVETFNIREGEKENRKTTYQLHNIDDEMTEVFTLWINVFGGINARQQEESTKVNLTLELLQSWFGDSMLQQPVRVSDLSRASVIDLLRILDYPSEFVPVVTNPGAAISDDREGSVPYGDSIKAVNKSALNAQLAQSYVTELMESAKIV